MSVEARSQTLADADAKLRSEVISAMRATWTAALREAASEIARRAMPKQTQLGQQLEVGLSAYRSAMLREPPGPTRADSLAALRGLVDQLERQLDAVMVALADQKDCKPEHVVRTLDVGILRASRIVVALRQWYDDLELFDHGIPGAARVQPPTIVPQPGPAEPDAAAPVRPRASPREPMAESEPVEPSSSPTVDAAPVEASFHIAWTDTASHQPSNRLLDSGARKWTDVHWTPTQMAARTLDCRMTALTWRPTRANTRARELDPAYTASGVCWVPAPLRGW